MIDSNDKFFDELPDELLQCVEELAENVHNKWADEKLRQGWVYGEHRDDKKKTSPCLIPYAELPEYEKNYDRITATETIKFLLNRGYTITRSDVAKEKKTNRTGDFQKDSIS